MLPSSRLCFALGVVVVGLFFRGSGFAAEPPVPEWPDPKGGTFHGTPVEALGPLVLFRTGATSSKFLPMRALSPEDCVRFYRATAGRPGRTERWSEARGAATSEFIQRLQRVENHELHPADLSLLPEPELLIVLIGSRRAKDVYHLLDNLAPFVGRVQRVYPGRVATVLMSSWGSDFNPRVLPSVRTWLLVDPSKQDEMKLLSRFVPSGGFVMLLMTREGIPLFGAPANDVADIMKFVDGASDFLWQLNPANPRTARDRAHYLRAVRPVEFAERKTGPLLLADLLRPEGLSKKGITRIAARYEVAADGSVGQVELLPGSDVPEPVRPALDGAIRRSMLFMPAMENGMPVAGSYDYELDVPVPDVQRAADAAWATGEARVELPIPEWLVLKPIHVPAQVFGGVDHVGVDGTVVMKAVSAGDTSKISKASQLNSFNSDWFSETGAASVHPKAGDKQEVDDAKLTWKRVGPENGLVDFMADGGNLDYCVGYAWTEIDSPADTDAWLGIGSDDGLKIWLNGEMVNDSWVRRTSRLDDDVVPLRLKKGKNAILIKIQNMTGRWSFICRLRVRGA